MIHVHAVGDFMRDCCVAHKLRGQDEPPAIANVAMNTATAPATSRVADPDRPDRNRMAGGEGARLGIKNA